MMSFRGCCHNNTWLLKRGQKSSQGNLSSPIIPLLNFLKLPPYWSAWQQHISCNVPTSHVFCFSRQDFMRLRLPVRWSSLGLPTVLNFSRRMCRLVVVNLSFFSTETLLCGCQKRPVPCAAPGWPEALFRGCSLLPGRQCMSGSENEEIVFSATIRMLLVFDVLMLYLFLTCCG